MTSIDASADLSWLLPILVGATLTALGSLARFVWLWLRRPILEVFQSGDPRETYVEIGLSGGTDRGYYVAVKVRNRGARAAKGCYAKLIKLEKRMADGRYERVLEFRDPAMLGWANRGSERFEEQSVERGTPLTIDLCCTARSHPDWVLFDVRKTESDDGRTRLFKEGVYRASVRVYADGATPATAHFIVSKGVGWKDVSIVQTCDKICREDGKPGVPDKPYSPPK